MTSNTGGSSTAKRRAIACLHCREKKVKCDGSHPCAYCEARNVDCVFPSRNPRRKYKSRLPASSSNTNRSCSGLTPNRSSQSQEQIAPANQEETQNEEFGVSSREDVLMTTSSSMSRRGRTESYSSGHRTLQDFVSTDQQQAEVLSPLPNMGSELVSPADMPNIMSPPVTTTGTAPPTDLGSLWDIDHVESQTSMSANSVRGESRSSFDFDTSLIEPNMGHEYHGATSVMAICSPTAIDWVTQRSGNKHYHHLSSTMISTIGEELKMRGRFSTERAPEPEFQMAWRYYEAYCQQADARFPVLHRPSFEARLRQTYAQPSQPYDDPAWVALRNIVYAAGKRQLLNEDSDDHSFSYVQKQCWPYFENAMSVHTELIFSKVTIMGVQALIAMAMFVEGLGSPCLEYMLLTSAARLAQSQGLHRHPHKGCNLSSAQITQRSLVFWSLYCYDKHISLRAGRPSAIDDRDITCEIPQFPHSKGLEGIFISKTIEHARLTSEITAWMARFRSKNIPLEESIRQLRKLDTRLTRWADSLPAPLRPGSDLKMRTAAKVNLHPNQILYIHYAHHGSVIAMNSMFFWPWLAPIMSVGNEALYKKQAQKSTALVIKSARAIIKLTHYIDIDCSTPVWLSFYYPFIAFANLFVYILHFPALSTIQMDLSLLDVIAGYFGRLELATAAAKSFPFVRDMAQCAHATVARCQSASLESNGTIPDPAPAVVSNIAYDHARMFSEVMSTDAVDPEASMNTGMFPDSFPPEVGSHMEEMDFSIHDPLLEFMDTDLSWGLLSAIPRAEAQAF